MAQPRILFFYKGTSMDIQIHNPRDMLRLLTENAHDLIVKERADGLSDEAIIKTHRDRIEKAEQKMVEFTKGEGFYQTAEFLEACYGQDWKRIRTEWVLDVLLLLELGAIQESEMYGTVLME
jgi:hypothetical protein